MTLDPLKCAKNCVEWSKIDPDCAAILHEPKRQGDVGWDLEAAEDVLIKPGEAIDVPTNVRLHLPDHAWAEIRARSSIARRGLQVDAGTIDTGYRGPLFALVRNMAFPDPAVFHSFTGDGYEFWYSSNTVLINAGERVAQIVFHPVRPVWSTEVNEIDPSSERGEDGFGSTGA